MSNLKCEISKLCQKIDQLQTSLSDFYKLHTNQIYALQNNVSDHSKQLEKIIKVLTAAEAELEKLKEHTGYNGNIVHHG